MKTVQIGGESRPFKIGYRTLRRARKDHGIVLNLNDVQEKAQSDWVDFFFTMLHVGLLHGDGKITREKVEEWIDADEDFDDAAATKAVMDGVASVFEGGDSGNAPKPPRKVAKGS